MIGPDCPLVAMAREQGGGVVRHTERGTLENAYVKREGVWKDPAVSVSAGIESVSIATADSSHLTLKERGLPNVGCRLSAVRCRYVFAP